MLPLDIRPDHLEIVRAILHRHVPDREVWAFGSRAKWTAKEYSDLDLCIVGTLPLDLLTIARINEDFADSDLPWKVDVVDWANTSEAFRKIIEQDRVVVQKGRESGLGAEWQEYRFGSLVRFVSDKSQAKDANINTYISTENMLVNFGGITAASALPLTGSVSTFKAGDTLFSNIRTYFRKVWQARFDGCCSNDVLVFRPVNAGAFLPDYLHQICRWEKFTELSIRTSKGAKMPRGDKDALADFKFRLPPIQEQRAIAHILGTLDDKIELNRKQNETLEAMARALFKAWFVDFEPVRAKLEGRWQRGQSLPGLPAYLYELFPDRLVESELGEIPEGWEVRRIEDVIQRLSVGKKYEQKTVSSKGLVPVLDQGKTGIIGFHNHEPGVVATPQMPVVVFANHTCYMRLISFSFSAIQNVLPFIGKNLPTIWVYHATIGKQSFIEYKGHWPDFVIHEIAVPPSNLAEEFANIASIYSMQIWENERDSFMLTQLRDTLLPKLISGDLRLPDAVAFLKERGL